MAHNITLKKVKQILGRESQQNLINHFQNFHKKTVNPDTKIQNTQKRLIGRRLQKKSATGAVQIQTQIMLQQL